MKRYIVNVSTGWKSQPGVAAVPPGEVVEIDESAAREGVEKGYLIAETDEKYLTVEHRKALDRHAAAKPDEKPAKRAAPPKAEANPIVAIEESAPANQSATEAKPDRSRKTAE